MLMLSFGGDEKEDEKKKKGKRIISWGISNLLAGWMDWSRAVFSCENFYFYFILFRLSICYCCCNLSARCYCFQAMNHCCYHHLQPPPKEPTRTITDRHLQIVLSYSPQSTYSNQISFISFAIVRPYWGSGIFALLIPQIPSTCVPFFSCFLKAAQISTCWSFRLTWLVSHL